VLSVSAVFESGNQEPIFPEKKCFLRSCFESLRFRTRSASRQRCRRGASVAA
jgi:hypothetical protein